MVVKPTPAATMGRVAKMALDLSATAIRGGQEINATGAPRATLAITATSVMKDMCWMGLNVSWLATARPTPAATMEHAARKVLVLSVTAIKDGQETAATGALRATSATIVSLL